MCEKNIFKILDITYNEEVVSNLIKSLINESREFAEEFLRIIVNMEVEGLENIEISSFNNVVTSLGKSDIIIKLESENDVKLVFIENKLRSTQSTEQLEKYSNEYLIHHFKEHDKLKVTKKISDIKYRYITLVPEILNGAENKFKNRIYNDFLNFKKINIKNESLDKLYKDFLEEIRDFYIDIEVDDNDRLGDIFSLEVSLAKMYIKFRKIFKDIEYTNDLFLEYIGKSGEGENLKLISKISKFSWQPEKAVKKNGYYELTEKTFDLHFEGYFNVVDMTGMLPVHYESSPYVNKDKLIMISKKEDYTKYNQLRECIKNGVHAKILNIKNSNIKKFNGSDTILRINLDIDKNSTVRELKEEVVRYTKLVSEIIDEVLENTNNEEK